MAIFRSYSRRERCRIALKSLFWNKRSTRGRLFAGVSILSAFATCGCKLRQHVNIYRGVQVAYKSIVPFCELNGLSEVQTRALWMVRRLLSSIHICIFRFERVQTSVDEFVLKEGSMDSSKIKEARARMLHKDTPVVVVEDD